MNYNIEENDLFDYKDMKIYQIKDAFKFSLDSILLAEYVKIHKNTKNILDLCTGNAVIPLIIAGKCDLNIVGFELQKQIYELAIKSVFLNKLDKRIKIINDDAKNIGNYFDNNYFDVIICNPPYFKATSMNKYNKNNLLSIARHEVKISLDDIFDIVKYGLKDNGTFYLIHRVNRIDDIFNAACVRKLFIKEMQFVMTNNDNELSLVLLKIKKQGKNGVKIPKVINVSNLKTYQNIFKE